MADGVVVVGGVFPPGSVVELVQVPSEAVLRSESGVVVGVRVVDGEGFVGFDGLELGGRFFVCGYADGRRVEVRAVGRPVGEVEAALVQPPILPEPVVVGLQNVTVADPGPAGGASDLPVGVAAGAVAALPPEVEAAPAAVVQTPPEVEPSPPPAQFVTPEDLSGAPAASETPREGAGSAAPVDTAGASGASAPGVSSAPAVPDPAGAVPPVDPTVPVGAADVSPASSAATTSTEPEPSTGVTSGALQPFMPVESAPLSPSAHEQLFVQAAQLGVADAATLADDQLRAAILEKNATPVA